MFDTFYKSIIMKFLIDLHLIQPELNLLLINDLPVENIFIFSF